jgi:hypothetical protein
MFNQLAQIHPVTCQLELARLDLGKIQQLIDEFSRCSPERSMMPNPSTSLAPDPLYSRLSNCAYPRISLRGVRSSWLI